MGKEKTEVEKLRQEISSLKYRMFTYEKALSAIATSMDKTSGILKEFIIYVENKTQEKLVAKPEAIKATVTGLLAQGTGPVGDNPKDGGS